MPQKHQKVSFISPLEEISQNCPFCNEKLGSVEYIKQKIWKICKCLKCGKTIDRRYEVY